MSSSHRRAQTLSAVCLALAVVACDESPTVPIVHEPSVRAVLGANLADTVDAQSLQALVAEVRGSNGELVRGAIVRFQAQPSSDTLRRNEPAVFVCALAVENCGPLSGTTFVVDTTDAKGRAKALVRLGHIAGRAVIRMYVPEFGLLDSAAYTVTPGALFRVHATSADTTLDIGQTAMLRGRGVDRYGNPRAELPTLTVGPGNSITLNAATGVVTATGMGTQSLVLRYQALVDSTIVRVLPPGRLVVWSSSAQAVRLVDINGSNARTLANPISSDLGAFPHFDATGQRITFHSGTASYGGVPNLVVVLDSTGSPRRDIVAANVFSEAITTRQIADGSVLIVGQRSGIPLSLFRVALDGTVTSLAVLPGMATVETLKYGGADISPDGSRVAYIANGTSGVELRLLTVATGAFTVLDANARSPRFSRQGDRLVYLLNTSGGFDGSPVVINVDGSGRRTVGNNIFSPGFAWSPDGLYIIGRSSVSPSGYLRIVRVSDAVNVLLTWRAPNGNREDYYQPDWR